MKKNTITKVIVRTKVFTEIGYWGLQEIKGLEEGTQIIGERIDGTNLVQLTWSDACGKKAEAVLEIGSNCELVATLSIEYSVAESNSLVEAASSENLFLNLEDAQEFKDIEGGYLFYGAAWIAPDGEYLDNEPPVYGKTEAIALNKLKAYTASRFMSRVSIKLV